MNLHNEDMYCVLPSGNRVDFAWIAKQVKARKLAVSYIELESGGRIYRVAAAEVPKLFLDDEHKLPYLGSKNEGYSLYTMNPLLLKRLVGDKPKWKKA